MRTVSRLIVAALVLAMLVPAAAFASMVTTPWGAIPEGYQVYGWGSLATSGKIGFLSGTRPNTIAAANWHPPAKIPFISMGKQLPVLAPLTRAAGIVYRLKVPGRMRVWCNGSVDSKLYVPIDTTMIARREGASIEYPVTGVMIAPIDSIGFKASTTDTIWYGVLYKVD